MFQQGKTSSYLGKADCRKRSSFCRALSCITLLASLCCSNLAVADTASPFGLQQALATGQHFDLYSPQNSKGLKIGSSYFSGSSSGVNAPENFADFNNNQQMYALLIDGRYDFNYDTPTLSSPLRPYLMGSMGVARATGYAASIDSSSSSTVPLFRLGGGVAYRLGEKWDMSLDYKAGLASSSPTDYLFTGRSQQQVDMQTLNVGMHYSF